MLRTNKKMDILLANINSLPNLTDSLTSLVTPGFFKSRGCSFLRAAYQDHFDHYTVEQMHDETGFEAFVNSIRLSDYVERDFLQFGIALASNLYGNSVASDDLLCSIVIQQKDAVIKLYIRRPDQYYLSCDLETYSQPIFEGSRSGIQELVEQINYDL